MVLLDAVAVASRLLAVLILLLTGLAKWPTDAWWVRIWDFPKLHFLVLGGLAMGGTLLTFDRAGGAGPAWVLCAVLALVLASHFARVVRYTPIWSASVPSATEPRSDALVRLLVVNLDYQNARHAAMERMIRSADPDVLLLVEIDEAWRSSLAGAACAYAHRVEEIRAEGLGMALWSRLKLRQFRIRHLVVPTRPSIHALIEDDHARAFCFAGIHPIPPGLPDSTQERHDSGVRDAELMVLAQHVARQRGAPWVVAGDFNDVAWSHTTRLFQRISGPRDPRIGRGLFNTFHARRPWMRFPIDHVFLSPGIELVRLERLEAPGSDHFAVLTAFDLQRAAVPRPDPVQGDGREAAEMIQEGRRDAAAM